MSRLLLSDWRGTEQTTSLSRSCRAPPFSLLVRKRTPWARVQSGAHTRHARSRTPLTVRRACREHGRTRTYLACVEERPCACAMCGALSLSLSRIPGIRLLTKPDRPGIGGDLPMYADRSAKSAALARGGQSEASGGLAGTFQIIRTYLKIVWSHSESRNIFVYFLINLSFMFVEFLYGYWSNSLGRRKIFVAWHDMSCAFHLHHVGPDACVPVP